MKTQAAERKNWNCEKYRTKNVRMLKRNCKTLSKNGELNFRNRELQDKLLLVGVGKRDSVPQNKIQLIAWWSVTERCTTLDQSIQM